MHIIKQNNYIFYSSNLISPAPVRYILSLSQRVLQLKGQWGLESLNNLLKQVTSYWLVAERDGNRMQFSKLQSTKRRFGTRIQVSKLQSAEHCTGKMEEMALVLRNSLKIHSCILIWWIIYNYSNGANCRSNVKRIKKNNMDNLKSFMYCSSIKKRDVLFFFLDLYSLN